MAQPPSLPPGRATQRNLIDTLKTIGKGATSLPIVQRTWGVVQTSQATHTPPSVTVTIAGSKAAVAGVRYGRSYTPAAGDRVLIDVVGSDLVVVDALLAAPIVTPPARRVSVSQSTAIADTNGVWTILPLDTKVTDPSVWFNTTTHVFQPTVAGWYRVDASLQSPYFANGDRAISVYKNGSLYRYLGGDTCPVVQVGGNFHPGGSTLVLMNGTTDYLDIRVYTPGTTAGGPQGGYADFEYRGV